MGNLEYDDDELIFFCRFLTHSSVFVFRFLIPVIIIDGFKYYSDNELFQLKCVGSTSVQQLLVGE